VASKVREECCGEHGMRARRPGPSLSRRVRLPAHQKNHGLKTRRRRANSLLFEAVKLVEAELFSHPRPPTSGPSPFRANSLLFEAELFSHPRPPTSGPSPFPTSRPSPPKPSPPPPQGRRSPSSSRADTRALLASSPTRAYTRALLASGPTRRLAGARLPRSPASPCSRLARSALRSPR
jgi:hypothetical protein